MKFVIALSVLVGLAAAGKVVYFTTGNDNLDVDAVMRDPAQLKPYMECFLGRAPCDPLSESYKKNMPESIATACKRCNKAQKHLWNRFLQDLKKEYPEYYEAYQKKYDPKKENLQRLEQAVAKY